MLTSAIDAVLQLEDTYIGYMQIIVCASVSPSLYLHNGYTSDYILINEQIWYKYYGSMAFYHEKMEVVNGSFGPDAALWQ